MEYFEHLALERAPLEPSHFKRFVDDTFMIWRHGKDVMMPQDWPPLQMHPSGKDSSALRAWRSSSKIATMLTQEKCQLIWQWPFSNHEPPLSLNSNRPHRPSSVWWTKNCYSRSRPVSEACRLAWAKVWSKQHLGNWGRGGGIPASNQLELRETVQDTN